MSDETIQQDPDFPAKELVHRSIEEKMRSSYLDYAMSVIVSRALPDVRDGQKPVNRRIMYAMLLAGNDFNKPFKKSARIVGDVLGKFHPHSQDAVYDAIVRMAQTFSLRYLLVDGQGNFGSVDGDDAAAMRYTEIRLTKLAHALMTDIEKETVDMMENYDGSEQEPTVLPPTFPALLANGSSGIAVGMATNIPPHNLTELINGCQLLLENPEATWTELFRKVKAPDFPTAGIIYGITGVREAYRTGNGRIVMRAKAEMETIGKNKRTAIIITELPYTVNKSLLVERIADLVRDKKLEGISDLRDESDRNGMRVVIELKRDAQPFVVQNNLFKMTEMQKNFSANMVALVHGVPRTLNLREMLLYFLDHRREVVYRRSLFELERAREKAHNLEGLAVAVSNIEEIIEIIKKSPSPPDAKITLMAREWHCKTVISMLSKLKDPELAKPDRELGVWGLQTGKGSKRPYRLSDRQAQSILDMRLARLTALERGKIVKDYEATIEIIVDLLDILDKPDRVQQIITEELVAVKEEFGDKRRTVIDETGGDIDNEDLIERREMVVTRSHAGYIKAQPLAEYRTQHRGGVGMSAAKVKEEDFITDLHIANSHDTMLFFTSRGRVYWHKVYQLPAFSRSSRGRPIVNLLPLQENEQIEAVLATNNLDDDTKFVVMATRNGTIKRTPLSAFANPRSKGIIAITIGDGDRLIDAGLCNKDQTVMLFTDGGMSVRFDTSKLRPTGRGARGVKGIRLRAAQEVVSMVLPRNDDQYVLTVTAKGLGKRTAVGDYAVKGRHIYGVVNISRSADTGKIVRCILVEQNDGVMLITDHGRLIRTKISSVRNTSRATKGVKIIRLDNAAENLVGIGRIRENISKEVQLDLIDGGSTAAADQADVADEVATKTTVKPAPQAKKASANNAAPAKKVPAKAPKRNKKK